MKYSPSPDDGIAAFPLNPSLFFLCIYQSESFFKKYSPILISARGEIMPLIVCGDGFNSISPILNSWASWLACSLFLSSISSILFLPASLDHCPTSALLHGAWASEGGVSSGGYITTLVHSWCFKTCSQSSVMCLSKIRMPQYTFV